MIREYITKEGFKKYIANTGWLVFGRGITLVISFFVAAYVARYLGPTNYGTLSYAVGFIGLFSFIANLGIDQVLYRELIKYPDQQEKLLGSSLIIKVIAGACAYVFVTIATFAVDRDWFVSSLIMIIGISFVLQPFQIINYYYQSKVAAKKTIIAQIAVVVILSIIKIMLVMSSRGIYYFSAIFVLEQLLYATFFISLYRKSGNIFKWKFDAPIAKVILKDSWPYMIAGAFALIYTRIDQIMIKHLIDATSVGIYDAAVRVAEVWYFVPGAIVSSVFPAIVMSRQSTDGSYERRLLHFFVIITGIALVFALPIHFLSGTIIGLLYGSKYVGAEGVLSIYVWGGIGYSLAVAVTQYLSAENYRKAIFVSSFSGMAVNVLLNIVWIPKYGIYGAAWATLIAYSIIPFSVLIYKPVRKHMKAIITAPFFHTSN
jgi:O-antigen/teichoic acid export membrane protein